MRYEHHVVIASPVARVFAYMDDVDREREWQPGIVDARKEPPGATRVGTRKRYVSEFLGRRIKNTYVTTLFEPNERVAYETTADSVLRGTVEVRFEAAESGTKVSMAVSGKPTGPLRFIPRGILESVFKKELRASLSLLKEKLEGEAR